MSQNSVCDNADNTVLALFVCDGVRVRVRNKEKQTEMFPFLFVAYIHSTTIYSNLFCSLQSG